MSAIIENARAAGPAVALPESLDILRPVVVDDLVRVGNKHDGGYVLAGRVISQADCLLSFGIKDDWTFEADFHRRNPQCIIHGYDHTVGDWFFRRAARAALKKWLLLKRGGSLARVRETRKLKDAYKNFFAGNRVHFEERIFNRADHANDATMEKIFSRIPDARHVVVKMDIDGGEYRVIRQLLNFQDRVDLVVMEFHDTEPLRQTFLDCVRQFLEHYQIIHAHGNNCVIAAPDGLPDILEMTFLNRRFKTTAEYRTELPVKGVDAPNFPDRPEFFLRFSHGQNV